MPVDTPTSRDVTHRGDCRAVMATLPAESIDLIVADPPFGLSFKSKRGNYNRDGDLVVDGYIDVPIAEYRGFSVEWIGAAHRVLRKTGSMYIFSGYNQLEDVLYALRQAKFVLQNHIIWKYQFGVFTKRKYVTSHYHILFVTKHRTKYFFNKVLHYPEDVWKIKRHDEDTVELDTVSDDWNEDDGEPRSVWIIKRPYRTGEIKVPNKLPPKLIRKILLFSSAPDAVILDPFCGGGSVPVEILRMNAELGSARRYVIIEKAEPMYDFLRGEIAKTLKI